MAFAKAEALTMVCMKNRFWTLIATYDNPNAVLQVGNEFGFIISIENIL